MEENEVFAYQVNTRMPIMGLSIGNLRSPKTVELTKEDVLICLKKAPVFRRFKTGKMERVNTANLDRLHREDFIDEAEYEKLLDKRGNVGEVKEEEVVEEKKETTPVVEEKPKEKAIEDVKEEVIPEEEKENDINDEKISEEVVVEEAQEEVKSEEPTDNNYQNNNYNKNKKKHNR